MDAKKDEILPTIFSGLDDDATFGLPPSRIDCRHVGIGIFCFSQCHADNFAVLDDMPVFGAFADEFIIILGI